MEKLREIIYVPTLRCNYTCTHCGQNRVHPEKPALEILPHLLDSQSFWDSNLVITGGEPFLKEDLGEFIVALTENPQYNHRISITTNGSFVDRIKQCVERISNKNKIVFAVSVDGTRETHNNIRGNLQAYDQAIQSIREIAEHGIHVSVNMVLQPINLPYLEQIQDQLKEVLQFDVPVSYIPLIPSISKDISFVYTKEETQQILPYLTQKRDRKYLLSGTPLKIRHCHAGHTNLLLAPDGKIYSCLTGFSYMKGGGEYFLGNLISDGLDTVRKKHQIVLPSVSNCRGCSNPCELEREESYYGLDTSLDDQDIENLKTIAKNNIHPYYYLLKIYGWHETEIYDWGSQCWMSGTTAKMLCKVTVPEAQIFHLSYINSSPENDVPMALTLFIDGQLVADKLVLHRHRIETLEFLLAQKIFEGDIVEIDFEINYTWRPSDDGNSADHRNLGMAVVLTDTTFVSL